MSKELLTAFFEYASTYDKILAVVGSILIVIGLLGGITGNVTIALTTVRQIVIVAIGLLMVAIPVLPLLFRDITLQELKEVKKYIDLSRYEFSRLHDKSGGDHQHYLDGTISDSQNRIDALIAKKEGNR